MGFQLFFASLLWGIHPSRFIFISPVIYPQSFSTVPLPLFFSSQGSSFQSGTTHTSNFQLPSFLLSHWIYNVLWHLSLGQNALLSSLTSFMPTGMSDRLSSIEHAKNIFPYKDAQISEPSHPTQETL